MKINKAVKLAIESGPKDVIMNILANSRNNEVFTVEELMELSGLDHSQTIDSVGKLVRERIGFARHKSGNRSFYGKDIAIKELKEGLIGKSKRSN